MPTGAINAAMEDLKVHHAVFEEDGAVWLRTTDYGDDKDRVLVKSDGDLTYLAPDIAYHQNKFERAAELFNVWGADHHGYVVRMKAAMQLLGHDPDALEIAITQMVDFMKDGEPMKMSGRSGNQIDLDEIIAEVGPDAARFTYLMQSVDSRQTFDLDEVAKQGMDNPVFYVQYAHARICSIFAKAAEARCTRGRRSQRESTPRCSSTSGSSRSSGRCRSFPTSSGSPAPTTPPSGPGRCVGSEQHRRCTASTTTAM